MTKVNQAVLAAASSIALFGGAMAFITPEAKAWGTTCSTIGDTTYCDGSNGSSTYNRISDTLYYDHNYGGNSWSGSCMSIGSTTYCD